MSPLEAFATLDLRVGTIVTAERMPEARKPAYRLTVDFGIELGMRRSSAQITALYAPEVLIGRQVLAAVNLPAKRIAGFTSEVLICGVPDEQGNVVLAVPERDVPNGVRLF